MNPRRPVMPVIILFSVIATTVIAGGCAGPSAVTGPQSPQSQAHAQPPSSSPPVTPLPEEEGTVSFDISDIVGRALAAKVKLVHEQSATNTTISLPDGKDSVKAPIGNYKAYVYVRDQGVHILVDIKNLQVIEGETAYVLVSLLEGSSGRTPLRDFDSDYDLAIDRVELVAGTDHQDPAAVPGLEQYNWRSPVLQGERRWYRGELHAHSNYGIGSESVSQLIKRAERENLDFLAIADRNTLAPAFDPSFQSDSVVLIPAMEWGSDDRGVALVYGPRTYPEAPESRAEAQAICMRVQAQGGIFAVAHPCLPTAPWQWGLSYVNAVETWYRGWREMPPLGLQALRPDVTVRDEATGKLTRSVAIAAATPGHSANGQAAIFWDIELNRGLKASAIAGSSTANPKVPMGEPLTYVFAYEKSLNGILDGLRRGRTFVSSGPDGPQIIMWADILSDGTINSGIGGIVPLKVKSKFIVEMQNAKGKRLEILLNGHPIRSTEIEADGSLVFEETPETYGVYRARIVEPPDEPGFGRLKVLAMTSPIYAQEAIPQVPGSENSIWLNLQPDEIEPWGPEQLPDPTNQLQPQWRL